MKKRFRGKDIPSGIRSRLGEVFLRFGYPDYDGLLQLKKFPEVTRYLGSNPSPEICEKLMKGVCRRKKKKEKDIRLTPEEFFHMFKSCSKTRTMIDAKEMIIAFQIFSPEEVRKMFSLSEHYTQEDFESVIMKRYYPDYARDAAIEGSYTESFLSPMSGKKGINRSGRSVNSSYVSGM